MIIQSFEQSSEAELIYHILNGNLLVYEIIVRRYNPVLYKTGRAYHFNHEDTQDLMQETYIAAFKNLSRFKGQSGFKTWLIRIMLHNCYHKKHKSAYKNESSNPFINENVRPMYSHSAPDAHKEIHSRELGHIIESSLLKIPEDYRLVFALREINGLNTAETSSLLHITESNVKVRLNRAKTMLRKEIESSYSPEDIFEFNLIYCDPFTERVMKKIKELR